MLGRLALKIQKQKINGPFKRVRFIDPYPDKILKFPSFPITNLLMLLGLLSFPVIFAIGYCCISPTIPHKLRNNTTEQAGRYIYFQVGDIAEYFQVDRLEMLGYIIPALLVLGIALVAMSNWLSRQLVVLKWRKNCQTAPAQILDSEIQKHLISQSPEHKAKPCYVLRLKVEFSYSGQVYEATPSVVNRIAPGSIGVHFPLQDDCASQLAIYQQGLDVEFDPRNPLDCEIKGQLDALLAEDERPWLTMGIFAGALFLFAQLFIYIIRNGPPG